MKAIKEIKTKEEEIQVLKLLFASKSYFADSVKEKDFLQMCTNIRHDFPLFFGTSFGNAVESLEEANKTINELDLAIERRNTTIEDLGQIIRIKNNYVNSLLKHLLFEKNIPSAELIGVVPLHDLVVTKLELGLPLNEAELNYAVESIELTSKS